MKRLMMLMILLSSISLTAQVGINTTTPLSTLDLNGNLSVKHLTLPVNPADFTAQTIDDGVYLSLRPIVNNQVFTLPSPIAFPGRVYILRNIRDINMDARIETAGGAQFFAGNNSTAGTTFVLLDGANTSTKTLIFISDGSNWTYGILGF